jgi:hypothetical protein
VIANPFDPGQVVLVEGHRPAGRGDSPLNKDFLQAAVLFAEVAPPLVLIALIVHSNRLSQEA